MSRQLTFWCAVKRTLVCLSAISLLLNASTPGFFAQQRRVATQTSRSKEITAANRSWPNFIVVFRAAVKKRDRTALKEMIATPFITQVDGTLNSPDEVIKWLDEAKLWGQLQREAAVGAKPSGLNSRGRPQRCTSGIFCFEFGSDGRWRLSEQGESELD